MSVSRSGSPVSGFCVVTAQRPTFPCGTTIASPSRTRRPSHSSSSCSRRPSMPKFIRKRRPSTSSTPVALAIARREAVPSRVAAPLRSRSVAGPGARTSRRLRPEKSEIASLHGPTTVRTGTATPQNCASSEPSTATCSETVVPSGKRSVEHAGLVVEAGARSAGERRGPCCSRAGRRRRRGRTPDRPPRRPRSARIRPSWRRARPLTGETEIQATVATALEDTRRWLGCTARSRGSRSWRSGAGRLARRAAAEERGVAAAGGLGRPAGQHAESRAAVAARAGRGGRAVDLGAFVADPAVGPSLPGLRRRKARLPAVLARRLPEEEKGRLRAEQMAERLNAHLGGKRMTRPRVGRALRIGNELRYATTTGTLAIRWGGARAPEVWAVEVPDIDPAEARRELARRYLHVYGPASADVFARWAGISRRSAAETFASLEGLLLPVRSPLGEESLLAEDEPELRAPRDRRGARAPAPERRRRTSSSCRQPSASSGPASGRARTPLDVPCLAGRAARRRRDSRHLATGAAHAPGRAVGTPFAGSTRRRRSRGACPAASDRARDRGGLGELAAAGGRFRVAQPACRLCDLLRRV